MQETAFPPQIAFRSALIRIQNGESSRCFSINVSMDRNVEFYPDLNRIYGLNRRKTYGHSMPHCEFVEHRVFPYLLYKEHRGDLHKLARDPRLMDSHSYFARLAWAGKERNVNLICLMLKRLSHKSTRFSPYFFYPTFSVEWAYGNQRDRLLMNAEGGFFCLAAFNFYPRNTGEIETTVIVRNWAVTRMLSNLNGCVQFFQAINKETSKYGLEISRFQVFACNLFKDVSNSKLDQILKVAFR